jgi:hypothetical protein
VKFAKLDSFVQQNKCKIQKLRAENLDLMKDPNNVCDLDASPIGSPRLTVGFM